MPASELESLGVLVCNNLPPVIDDLYICARDIEFDGPGGILGRAVISAKDNRSDERLPVAGYMEFDTADLQSLLNSGKLHHLLVHEMGHLLGIGPLWRSRGLTVNLGTYANSEWVYVGTHACNEWRNVTNCTGCPPVENHGSLEPGHWDESGMEHELMTGLAEPDGAPNPLSRISLGSLEDLGYTVDYSMADEYSFENLSCPGDNEANRYLRKPAKPQLSMEGKKIAQHYGENLLERGRNRKPDTIGGDLVYTADQHISVIYQENDAIFFVDVETQNG